MNKTTVLNYSLLTTPIGKFLVVVTSQGLCDLRLIEGRSITNLLEDIRRAHPGADLVADDKAVEPMARKIEAVIAVASACARNPVAFVVPCHRIVRKGGGLGGYYWGSEMKQQLLEREK